MIEVDGLGRYFGDIKAVDGLHFSVQRGEVLGFLGPNGAGKSTTMKMLTCFLTPSFGTARVNGFDIQEHSLEVRKSVGYLPENAPLYGEMEVLEFLQFIAEIRELQGAERKSAIDRVVEMTSLQRVMHQRIETLSKGFRRRVGLAQALIHDPDILILDEPTDGLDPNQKHDVRNLINSMREKCVILSTHILEEVDAVCSRAIIIAQGKIVADDTPATLKRRSPSYGAVALTFAGEPGADVDARLKQINGVEKVSKTTDVQGGVCYTLFPREATTPLLPEVVRETERNSWEVRDVSLESGQLDEVFRQITQ